MRPYRHHAFLLLNACALLLADCSIVASAQTVAIQVSDVHDRPIAGAVLTTKGNGSTGSPTDVAGKAQVQLPRGLEAGDELALVLVKIKPPNFRFLSPWQGRAVVPKPTGFVDIVLGVIGDKAALGNPKVVSSLAAEIYRQNNLTPDDPGERKRTLQTVSREAGFSAADIDSAIRTLERDPKQRKFVEAYEKNYPNAPKMD